MRHSGLAIRDASTLRRSDLSFDESKKLYRVIRQRKKTGAHVYVPLPEAVANELLSLPNDNPTYFFWDRRTGDGRRQATRAGEAIAEAFKAAGVHSEGHMISHRLRDSFAVGMLVKGVPLETVSILLGHRSVITTQKHYAPWIKERQDRLDNLVMATWQGN
jgi:integrase